jgi:hypothetical protein
MRGRGGRGKWAETCISQRHWKNGGGEHLEKVWLGRFEGNRLSRMSLILCPSSEFKVGRDGVVGIATCYELDGPGIESRWRRVFRTRPDRPWGPPGLLCSGCRVSFPGVKRPGRGVNHLPPSSAEVKERVELHLYSPSGPSWPVLGLYFQSSSCGDVRFGGSLIRVR